MDFSDHIVRVYWTNIPEFLQSKDLKKYWSMLDDKEMCKFKKMIAEKRKIEFVVGRLLLKKIIGGYLDVPPQDIHFVTNEFGKLYLEKKVYLKSRTNNLLHFNLSHTRRLVACAISPLWEVGIDVEEMTYNYLEAMPLVFTKSEVQYVKGHKTVEEQINAFYWIWTRKEAVMKAEGKGFSMHPKSFSVPFNSHCEYSNPYNFFTFHPKTGSMISVVLCNDRQVRSKPEYRVKKFLLEKILV